MRRSPALFAVALTLVLGGQRFLSALEPEGPLPPAPPEAAPCCTSCYPLKTICVPTTEVNKKVKVVYSMKEEPICDIKPRFSLWSLFRKKDRCEDDCVRCGKPRMRRVLIKRFVNEEECVNECVPVSVPDIPCGRKCK